MEQPTFEQVVEKQKAMEAEIAELRSGINYAVYGIGNPHPDPREGEAEAVTE